MKKPSFDAFAIERGCSCLWILLKSVWKRQFFNCEFMFSSLVQWSLDIWKQVFVVRMLIRVVDIFIQISDSDLVQFMFLFRMTSEICSFEKLCIAYYVPYDDLLKLCSIIVPHGKLRTLQNVDCTWYTCIKRYMYAFGNE